MYIRVNVYPNSKKEEIVQEEDGSFRIRIREPAERNLANKRVLELLRNQENIPKGLMKIVSGGHSPHKIIYIQENN